MGKGIKAARELAQTARGTGEGLTWFEIHTARIQEMLNRPFGDWTQEGAGDTTHVWEGTYQQDGQTVTSRVWRVRDGPSVGVRSCRKLVFNSHMGDSSASEVCAWLGLDEIDPESFEWHYQDFLAQYVSLKDAGIQVVRGKLPDVKAN